jgi:uncharacterized membrane protein YfcA
MTALALAALSATVLFTSFLSGIFGMAGGLILMGALLVFLPVPAAMALHGITQTASNGWRAVLWRKHILWRPTAFYAAGGLGAMLLCLAVQFVPSRAVVLLTLGLLPLVFRRIPKRLQGDPRKGRDTFLCGLVCVVLMLTSGAPGPLLDSFLQRGGLDRKAIVATKGVFQVFGHMAKIVYFGGFFGGAEFDDAPLYALAIAVAMAGTTLGGMVLARMSDADFRRWTDRIILVVCSWYVAHGLYLLAFGQGG